MNSSRTPQFYMANLGSEVVGMYSAIESGDMKRREACYGRAKKIISDFSAIEKGAGALTEISKLEEIIDDLALGGKQFEIPKTDIEQYFFPFALRMM